MARSIKWLAVCVVLIFFGRAYHYFFWDSPIRVLVWDQTLFAPVVEGLLGLTWEEYASDVSVDKYLTRATKFVAAFFALAGFSAVLLLNLRKRWMAIPVVMGSLLLVAHALLEMKDHFYHVAQLVEFATQIGAPLLLVWAVLKAPESGRLLLGMKIVIALTFVAHGLYAVGFYPVPGHFVDMTISILGISESAARSLLFIAGWLDLLLGIVLFVPATQKIALYYAIGWGLLTALARIVSGFDADFPLTTIHASAYATVYRLPHGLLPLAATLLLCKSKKTILPKL